MSAKYPCSDCLIKVCCTKFCEPFIYYFKRLIIAYVRNGFKSTLISNASEEMPHIVATLIDRIDEYNYVTVKNGIGEEYVVFGRSGTILESGEGFSSQYFLASQVWVGNY